MTKDWLVFEYNGNDILSITLAEATIAEVKATVGLLAYENECDESEISIRIVAEEDSDVDYRLYQRESL